MTMVVLAIDPGREKCGMAVVDQSGKVLHKAVVATSELMTTVDTWGHSYGITTIVMGNGTGSKEQGQWLEKYREQQENMTFHVIDEYKTTEMARLRYWQENPPAGWRRLLPVSLQVPPVPVDDYVAVLLAEKFIKNI